MEFALQPIERAETIIELAEAAALDSRKQKKVASPRFLTGERAGRIRLEIESQFERMEVSLSDSDLSSELRSLDWLARFPVDIFGPSGAYSTDPSRTVEAFAEAVRLDHLMRCLRRAEKIKGVERVAKHLKGLSGKGTTPDERPQQAAENNRQEISALLANSTSEEIDATILGVLLCATVFEVLEGAGRPASMVKRFDAVAIPNPAFPMSLEALEFHRNIMIAGERELWLQE